MYRFWQWILGGVVRKRIAGIHGLEKLPRPPFLIAANHVDYLDGMMLSAIIWPRLRRRIKFLSKASNYWIFGDTTIRIGADRAKALEHARRAFAAGDIICFFIEGERNPTGRLLDPKTGVVRLALATGAPIVPVGIRGPSFDSFFTSLQKTRGVEIRIGEPVRVQRNPDESPEQVQKLTDEVAATVARLAGKLPPAYAGKTYREGS